MNQPRPPAPRRAGTVTATLVLAVLAGLPLAGAASAAPAQDIDCPGLARSAAQAILAADPSDPNRLDRDGDGVACEGGDPAPSGGQVSEDASGEQVSADPSGEQVSVVPSGGVAAGDGSGGPAGPANAGAFLLVGTGAVVATGAGAAVWAGRRAGRPGVVRS